MNASIWASCTLSGGRPWIAFVELFVAFTMWYAWVRLGVVRYECLKCNISLVLLCFVCLSRTVKH